MSAATVNKQVLVTTSNKAGEFAAITAALSDAKVNLVGICAWSEGDKANFALLADNVTAAKNALKAKGYQVAEEDVITVKLEDKVGAAADIAKKIKDAGINLDYVYGTVCGCADTKALLVVGSKEKTKILSVLNA
ncbi:MAG: hypothetical protein PHS61_00555 [Candidatus Omnitrophica bacterium]|nr:hypothetical protein [Candidatus Omnitrophota bacterium]